MMRFGNLKRAVSGFMALLTVLTTVMSPLTTYAAETPKDEPPLYEAVKDLLDAKEVVKAKDYEIYEGDSFDISIDFTGLEDINPEKVKVTFHEAKNDAKEDFNVNKAGSYKAVYYVEPLNPDHPKYQISRKIVVKEKPQPKAQSESSGESKSEDKDSSGEDDADAHIEDQAVEDSATATENKVETTAENPETEKTEDVSDQDEKTENFSDYEELTLDELDQMAEEYENQDTYDEETGLTMTEVLEEGEVQGINLEELETGETVTFEVAALSVNLMSASTTKSVSITKGNTYHYGDYGLGSFFTSQYHVHFGNVSAVAYCVQPSKYGPDDGTYTITKLKDSKTLAKVCYYGTKAAGDEGFFEEKHPDFSAGKRFVITHIAASYANGSGDWDSGTNSTGRALAMELYNYCVSMPDIPDVDMEFSDNNVKAYIDGNIQRTKSITFKADALQSITFKLPNGVKLVNETTGKTSAAGANVEISGGTKFHLTAPITQAEDVAKTWSTTMKGSITKDFSAYKISTGGSTQDLGLVFGEGVDDEKYIDFKVTWTTECYVQVVKKDSETGNGIAGAVYGIYSDAACTKLIAQMPATDANGASKVTIEKTQNTVYIKEISVPTGYLIDVDAHNVTLKIGSTSTCNVKEQRVKVTVNLIKKDAETGSDAQGDAKLSGAIYGLYAREDIIHPDGHTGIVYKAGTLIATMTTDEEGKASVEDLYLGKYYVKETTPSEGYLIDETEHDLNAVYKDAYTPVIEVTATSKEQVKKQPFQVIKAADNGKTDADLLSGVGFKAYLKSSLAKKSDGSYDFDSATAIILTEDGKQEMFTDAKGYALSIPIPYGTYIVRETTTPHNFKPVDDFEVVITENKPTVPQVWRVLLDDEFRAKLKIIKQDDETKKPVLIPNTEFKVYDMDHGKYVEQVTTYPKVVTHKSYFTDSDGYLILPKNLKPGNYRIEEINAPEGYTLNTNYVEVSVDQNTAYQMDQESGDAIIEVIYENHPVKGQLTVYKTGEMVSGFEDDFIYEEGYLSGAEFEVYAAEDIYTADFQKDADGNRTTYYVKDELVTTITTDEDGRVVAEELPLGKYYVKEKNAPTGFLLNTVAQDAEFAYVDQNTAVIEDDVTFNNDRQKVAITVEKQDAETEATVAGAVFGIYNAEDIIGKNGSVIVEADTLLQEFTSDEDGQAVCTLDLPLGNYYVKELQAPDGYVSSDEIITFDASYQGQDIPVVELKSVKKNEPTTVEITKSDLTTGVELDGASLSVRDEEDNIIDSWTSIASEPHVIKRLVVGKKYILREELAPYGYLKATEIEFTIDDTAEVQKVEMKDDVPVALLMVDKKGEFLDDVSLVDHVKGIVEHIFEYISGSLTEVSFEVYAEEDIKAADGVSEDYYKADELIATITTDSTGIAKLENLPCGKYYIKEVATKDGYVLDDEIRHVDLSYVDQDTPIVTYNADWQNARQRVAVTVVKKEKGTERTLAGGRFGLFAGEDIVSQTTGNVLLEKDEIIELKVTDENGLIHFIADLPIGGKYYVKELYAPDGFVNTEEMKEFTFDYQGAETPVVAFDFTFEDEPTTVEITKSELTTGKEIPGARLEVRDEDGNLVDEWVSTEEPHVIKELTVGKEYTLTERKPADGFVTAESIEFKIENTVEVQKVEMKDDVTKIEISKVDITGDQEIPGAKITILDEDDQVVESWTSTEKPHYIEKLPIGKYTLREEQAPKGYIISNDVKFEVKDTADVQKVAMVDETAKGKIIINKKDADTGKPLKGVEFELRDSKGKVLETLKTDAAGHAESKLYEIASFDKGVFGKNLKYYLVETKALDGYELDKTKHEITFEYVDQNTPIIEVKKDLTNKGNPDEVPGDSNPGGGGSSPKTGDETNLWLPILAMVLSLSAVAGRLVYRRRKRNLGK